jgi:hypothetical protein
MPHNYSELDKYIAIFANFILVGVMRLSWYLNEIIVKGLPGVLFIIIIARLRNLQIKER